MAQGDSFYTAVSPSGNGSTEVTAATGNHVTIRAFAMNGNHRLNTPGGLNFASTGTTSRDDFIPIDDTNGVVVNDTNACQETSELYGVQHK